MHEKTLLYGALGCTAIAAVLAVTLGRGHDASSTHLEITPVSLTDAKTLASNEVPIRLTSSDGTGLRLQSLSANAVVEDPLALTELHLTFENPEARILEGTFRITLPQGASLSRFAMKVNGVWQEGEVVEKQAARRAYEDFLHRKQDPALMEQGAGNEFSARVFPIPANGIKEIMIAYTETVEAGAPYVLPLRGLPQLGTLDIDVHAAGSQAALAGDSRGRVDLGFSLHQQRITPAQDFVVEGRQLPRSAGLRSGDMAITRVVPFASSRPEPIASAVVLVDTSASRGLGLPDQARLLKSVLSKMNPDAPITVACFDQEVVPLYEGKAGGFGDKEVNAIIARAALGASDFEQALGWAGEQAKRTKAKRVILVGDGVATAGETDAQKLKEKVERLRDAGVERMDAIADGRHPRRRIPPHGGARRARSRRRRPRREARLGCARAPPRRGDELRRAREGRRRDVVVAAHARRPPGRRRGDGLLEDRRREAGEGQHRHAAVRTRPPLHAIARSSSAPGRRRRSRASSTRPPRTRHRPSARSSRSPRSTACSARTPRCSSSRPTPTTRASTSTATPPSTSSP